MRLPLYVPVVLLLCSLTNSRASESAGASPHLPFAFVENRGQADPAVRYIGTGEEFKAWFMDGGVVFQQGSARERMDFVGGRPSPTIEAGEPTGAKANYLRGQDPSHWQTSLPLFGGLVYRGVWPGIDIRFKAESLGTKAEYVVAPGSAVSQIRLRFDGRPEIEKDGGLIVSNKSGRFREEKPVLFQETAAGKVAVSGEFRIFRDGTVGFEAGSYDKTKALIVDPSILFSGYVGSASQTTVTGVAVNSYYNIVVTGWTIGTDLAASGGAQTQNRGGVDAFVAEYNPAGGTLMFCTYLGGSGDDRAFGVTVDAANNTYVTGWTSSANFPVSHAVQPRLGGSRDAFVAELNPAGNALVFSTYLGGTGADSGNAIALDSSNGVVVAGDTTSANMPVTVNAFQRRLGGSQDVFLARLSPGGAALSYLTYYGGNAVDHAAAVRLDKTNAVYFGGSTYSSNLPLMQAEQPQQGGGQDGFVGKLSADLSTLLIGTYLGGSGGTAGAPEEVNGIEIPVGNCFIAVGTTSSPDFPIKPRTFQPTYGGGNTDGFIARFIMTTGALVQSTFVGGSLDDGINTVASDYDGYLYVAGFTTSGDFPILRPIQNSSHGGMDAFVAKMTPALMVFGSYLGGSGNDSATALAIDSRSSIVVTGTTGSANFPVKGTLGGWTGGTLSSFITKVAPDFRLAVVAPPVFYFDTWSTTGYNGPNQILTTSSFGNAGDIPVAGDWMGTGTKSIGVFRNGTWYLDTNNNGVLDAGDLTIPFGQAGDIPIVGDWTGSGRVKLGLFRNGSFILDLSGHLSGVPTGMSDATFAFGQAGDIPVAADWNSSGATKVGVFRNGLWLVDYNGDRVFDGSDRSYMYGQAGDTPVVGDWNSSGTDEIGIYRHGTWILNYNGSTTVLGGGVYEMYLAFGGTGYLPLVY